MDYVILTDAPQEWEYTLQLNDMDDEEDMNPDEPVHDVDMDPVERPPGAPRPLQPPPTQGPPSSGGQPIPDTYYPTKGRQVYPNGSFEDIMGKRFDIYTDSMGVTWILEDREIGLPEAIMTIDEWNHQYEGAEIIENDSDDEELMEIAEFQQAVEANANQRVDPDSYQEWQKKLERAKHRRRLKVQNENERRGGGLRLDDERPLKKPLDTPITKKEILEQLSRTETPQRRFRRWLDDVPGSKALEGSSIPSDILPKRRTEWDFNPWVRNLGPFNTVSSYDEAVAGGPLSVAAWRHD